MPPVTLCAAVTVDGKLDDPAPRIVRHGIDCLLDVPQTRALLEAGLVDEIHLRLRPRIDGRRDAPTLTGPPTSGFFPRSVSCRLLRMENGAAGECLLHYRVLRAGGKAAGRQPR